MRHQCKFTFLNTLWRKLNIIPSFLILSCLTEVKLGHADHIYSHNGIIPHQLLNHVDKWEYYSLLKTCTWLNVEELFCHSLPVV